MSIWYLASDKQLSSYSTPPPFITVPQILTIIISISFKSEQWNSSPLGRPVLLITPRTLAVRHKPVHHLVILQYLRRKWRLHVRQTKRLGPEPAQTLDEESKTVRLEVCHLMSIHF